MMSVDKQIIENLNKVGVAIVPDVLDASQIKSLRQELVNAIAEDSGHYPDVFDKGMVHNCMVRGKFMAQLLDNPVLNSYIKEVFSETCILYAYQSSSLLAHQTNYGNRIHVDSPRFIPGYQTNFGAMFPLDDFTLQNGATYYQKGSHLQEHLPGSDEFFTNADRVICKAGDMILLWARVVHAAGFNSTDNDRHALTMNFCRSYMRQRFDFPRLVPPSVIESLGEDGRRLLGMNVRMPTTLDEFYLPVEQRLYKPNQG